MVLGLFAALATRAGRLRRSSAGKEGGTLTGSYASFPDYLDPALSYTAEGWTAMYDTYIPLLTYAHANGVAGSKVVPGLAESLPKITNGGKTYTLYPAQGPQVLRRHAGQGLRLHLRGRTRLQAQLPRLALLRQTSSAPKSSPKPRSGGIPGIETNDKTGEIVIDLVKPRGTFTNELGLLFVGPASAGHADQEPHRQPAAGDRALHDHQVRTGPRLELRTQPAVGEEQRAS